MINIIKNKEELMNLVSQKDCTELKNLIIENPEAPLLIFVGEEAWSGEYGYECTPSDSVSLEDVTLYDGFWLNKDYYEDNIWDKLRLDERYKNLSDEEYEKEVNKIVEDTAFIKAIVVYVG